MPDIPPQALLLIGLVFVVGVIVWLFNHQSAARAAHREERVAELSHDADIWVAQARQGLKPIPTRLILKRDEHAILEEPSTLLETRSYRVYGGAGTRIGRFYVGGGASESQQRLKQIDDGTLTLTT